jgi:hypothetical protein
MVIHDSERSFIAFSQNLGQFLQNVGPVIRIFNCEFGFAQNWIEIEKYLALISSLGQKDFC